MSPVTAKLAGLGFGSSTGSISLRLAGEEVKISDYLRVRPEAPAVKRIVSYALQMSGPLEEDNCRWMINSSVVPPPLVDHVFGNRI